MSDLDYIITNLKTLNITRIKKFLKNVKFFRNMCIMIISI